MARTVKEIYSQILEDSSKSRIKYFHDQIISDVGNEPLLLDKLTSNSKTAIWRLWAFVMAVSAWVLESLFDDHKEEVNILANEAKPLTTAWYRRRALDFQYGYNLSFINEIPSYAINDDASKIIARAAVVDSITGQITIKVTKDVAGVLTPLTAAEKIAFEKYIDLIQGAGDNIIVSSLSADLLKLSGTIYYNPLVFDPNDLTEIETAIDDYLSGIDFNGKLSKIGLEDALQKVTGIEEFNINILAKANGAATYTTVLLNYQAVAGYIQRDESAGNSLSETLNFIPDV